MPHPLGSPARSYHSKASEATYTYFRPKPYAEKRHCGVNLRLQPDGACHVGVTSGTTVYQAVGNAGRDEEAAETQLVLPSHEHGASVRLPALSGNSASRFAGRSAEIRDDWRSEPRSNRAGTEGREAAKASAETEHSDRQAVTDALLTGAVVPYDGTVRSTDLGPRLYLSGSLAVGQHLTVGVVDYGKGRQVQLCAPFARVHDKLSNLLGHYADQGSRYGSQPRTGARANVRADLQSRSGGRSTQDSAQEAITALLAAATVSAALAWAASVVLL